MKVNRFLKYKRRYRYVSKKGTKIALIKHPPINISQDKKKVIIPINLLYKCDLVKITIDTDGYYEQETKVLLDIADRYNCYVSYGGKLSVALPLELMNHKY